MALQEKFTEARKHYTEQILDAIDALEAKHPFGAVTLACCAIDLLSHVLHDPPIDRTGEFFETTVRSRLKGYRDFTDAILQLRNGMVHTFRTGADYLPISLSSELSVEYGPERSDDHVLLSVAHFINAVRQMLEHFFGNANDSNKRRFVDIAFIHIQPLPERLVQGRLSSWPTETGGVITWTPAASGTTAPFPGETFQSG